MPVTTSGLETERVYSQRKRQVREEISKERAKKKDKWESIRYKQANSLYSAEINNRIEGALRPGAGTERVYCGDEMCTADAAPRAAETARLRRLSLQRLTSNRSADIKRQPSYVFII